MIDVTQNRIMAVILRNSQDWGNTMITARTSNSSLNMP